MFPSSLFVRMIILIYFYCCKLVEDWADKFFFLVGMLLFFGTGGAEVDTMHPEKCHVLTYEDEEGDLMMVGDVPWE